MTGSTQCTTKATPPSPSWVEVSLDAIRHNVRETARLVGEGCGVWAVVKANAYGHGALEVARAALEAGAVGLAVASTDEAAALRRSGICGPILVLSAGDPAAAADMVQLGVTQTLCTTEMAEALAAAARQIGRPASVHVKVDTGMGRLGVLPENALAFVGSVCATPELRLEGVFSHLATAEDSDESYAREQFARFQRVLADLAAAGVGAGVRHIANSAATLRFPMMRLDVVRVGLLTYGIDPGAAGAQPIDLRPALTWKTRLAFTKRVPAGTCVSYGRTYTTDAERSLGVLPVGYADGYPRHASNRAKVLVRGRLCPVVGVVCMDHVIVDVTSAPGAAVGDEVILVGRQGNATITANQLAEWADTVVHHIPTAIGSRAARVYLDRRTRPASEVGSER